MLFFEVLDVTNVLAVFALTLFLCSTIYNWIRTRNYPPGPRGLPLIGYVPFLGKYPNHTLWNLSKKYGDIFSFYIGSQQMICITDYRIGKEILNHPMALARPPHSLDFVTGRAGFGGMSGDEWHEQRRFSLITMRNLGMGRGLWETLIKECASDLVNEIRKENGKPFSYNYSLTLSQITNSLSLLFGRHLNIEKEREIIEVTVKFSKMLLDQFSAVSVSFNNPFLGKIVALFNFRRSQEFVYLLRKFEGIFEKEIKRRLQSKEELTQEDFIGCYLKEIEKRKNDKTPHSFTLESLQGNMFLLYVAGQDSTEASVGWLLLLMAKFPDVQKKLCDEIDSTIGRDGIVYYDDKVNLPYTTATMYEMLRYITINAIFPPRYVLEDFELGGYTIAKGAHIVSNCWAMMHDPRYHDDPMEFKPERFLIENGTKLKKMDGYGPFSFGKRNCPGEGVATMNMYLYFVSIMQKFNIKTPHGGPPDMEYKFSGGTLPNHQDLCFIER